MLSPVCHWVKGSPIFCKGNETRYTFIDGKRLEMTAYNKVAEGTFEEPVTFNCCANSTVLTVDGSMNRKVAQLCQLKVH